MHLHSSAGRAGPRANAGTPPGERAVAAWGLAETGGPTPGASLEPFSPFSGLPTLPPGRFSGCSAAPGAAPAGGLRPVAIGRCRNARRLFIDRRVPSRGRTFGVVVTENLRDTAAAAWVGILPGDDANDIYIQYQARTIGTARSIRLLLRQGSWPVLSPAPASDPLAGLADRRASQGFTRFSRRRVKSHCSGSRNEALENRGGVVRSPGREKRSAGPAGCFRRSR